MPEEAALGCELEVEPETGDRPKTSALLQVSVPGGEAGLDAVLHGFHVQAEKTPDADAELTPLPDYCRGVYAKTIQHH